MKAQTAIFFSIVQLVFTPVIRGENAETRQGLPQTLMIGPLDSGNNGKCTAEENPAVQAAMYLACTSVGLYGAQPLKLNCFDQSITLSYRCVGNTCVAGICARSNRPENDGPRVWKGFPTFYNAPPELSTSADTIPNTKLTDDALDAGIDSLGNTERRALLRDQGSGDGILLGNAEIRSMNDSLMDSSDRTKRNIPTEIPLRLR